LAASAPRHASDPLGTPPDGYSKLYCFMISSNPRDWWRMRRSGGGPDLRRVGHPR
jgi:hypothetical protein